MNPFESLKKSSADIASHTPGRLRIRLHPGNREAITINRIMEKIRSKKEIHQVKANPPTGSLTVHYNQAHYGESGIFQVLKDADVVLADLTGKKTVIAMDLTEAVNDLSRRFGVDLGNILPLAFFGAGLWSFYRKGLMIESIPGWLFIWLAMDTFLKLHRQP